jgi:hypothetical protein
MTPTPDPRLTDAGRRLVRELSRGQPSENWLSIASWVEAALPDIEAEAAARGAALSAQPTPPPLLERLYFAPEDVELALGELGPTATYAEGLVKVAALACVHVMRGGRLEVAVALQPPDPGAGKGKRIDWSNVVVDEGDESP